MRRILFMPIVLLACSSSQSVNSTPYDAAGDVEEEDTADPKCTALLNKGPWSLGVDGAHAKIRWEACVDGASGLTVEKESGGGSHRVASVVTARVVASRNEAPLRVDASVDPPGTYFMHEVALEGLEAGTCYRYVLDADATAIGRFCTARASGEPFSFVALADTNPGFGPTTALLPWVYASSTLAKPDFTLHAGDLQYYASGLDTYQFWFTAMAPMLRAGALFHSIGNHESEKPDEREEYVDRFWGLAGFDGTKDYFRFENGGVWFFALDTEEPLDTTTTQGTWLATQLDDASKKPGFRFAVVYFHKPWVTCGDKSDSEQTRLRFKTIFDAAKVKLVIQGHMHAYERFEEIDGRTWLTIGGGGGALGDPNANPTRATCANRKASGKFFEALHIAVGATALTGTVVDESGTVRDTFSLAVP